MPHHEPAITAALDVMAGHLTALNRRDARALAETLHFPHYRLAGTTLTVWQTADTYFDDFTARAGDDWALTRWRSITVQAAAIHKLHLDVEIDRFDANGRLIAAFRSLWVISEIDGRWAAQFRSSFAPA